ncbi:MAG: phosphotransferase [Kangiella sp.]|nr:phosphotransferase [Kangiella sp.]
MNNRKQPEWWRYSESSWQQLIELLTELQPDDFGQCANQANWQLLRQGDTNANFKLSLAHQDYFVQVADQAKVNQLPSGEYRSQTRLVSENPALSKWLPKCLLDTEVIRVSIWLYANPTVHQHFFNPELSVELCRLLVELHDSSLSLPTIRMQEHLNSYHDIARNNQPQKADYCLELYEQALEFSPDFNATHSCHNDISPGNLLVGHQLFLVDWEYAAISDPVFELAGISHNFQLTHEQEQLLLEEYQTQSDRVFNQQKFLAMKGLYRIISELWYMGNEQS